MSLLRDLPVHDAIPVPIEVILKPAQLGTRYLTAYLLVGGVMVAGVDLNADAAHLTDAAQALLQKWLGLEAD